MALSTCHICTNMSNEGRRHPGSPAGAESCRLCKRAYCLAHKSTTTTSKDVCEINHNTYRRKHPAEIQGWNVFATLGMRERELGEEGVKGEEKESREMMGAGMLEFESDYE